MSNYFFFFSSRRRHTRSLCDWSSDVCSSDLRRAGGDVSRHRVMAALDHAGREIAKREGTPVKTVLALALAFLAAISTAAAQDYPERIITLVSPFPPGGPSDTTARLIIGPMSKALGQQIIVENVTGAGGVIGSSRVAKAKPDGYTLIVAGSGTHAAAEFLQKDLAYRSTDFDYIGLVNISPMVL